MISYSGLGLKPIINASEPYTKLGGSLMRESTIETMRIASSNFINMEALTDYCCNKVANITKNEAAFITTGAAAGLVLCAAACSLQYSQKLSTPRQNNEEYSKKEVLMFEGAYLQQIPYWNLVKNAGVNIKLVNPDENAINEAVNENSVGFFLFPGTLYEKGILTCEEAIPLIKRKSIPIIVDAAAQLPPSRNLWYYTKILGADIAIFSGGKHIRGPQSTGLLVGRSTLIRECRSLASPHPGIGRPFKTSKEELLGFTEALECFLKENEEERFNLQLTILNEIQSKIRLKEGYQIQVKHIGRLGTYQPLLWLNLPKGISGKEVSTYTLSRETPIDIGYIDYDPEQADDRIFINAYNLLPSEVDSVVKAINEFIVQH